MANLSISRINPPEAFAPYRLAEIAAVITGLGPIADQLGSRATVAQYEADFGDPARTRAGTSFAGSAAPLPRFMPMRDIVTISFNLINLQSTAVIPQRLANSLRIPTDDNLFTTLPYAPSLRAALELAMDYGSVMLPWFRQRLDVVGDALHIVYAPAAPLGRLERITTELSLVSTCRTVETFVGPRISAARMHFAVPPVSGPATIADRLGCSVSIGGEEAHLAVPLAWSDLPSPYHDTAQWQEGVARCEADMRQLQDVPLVARVRGHVRHQIDHGCVSTIRQTAETLGMSIRTVIRALAAAGVTHHQLVDMERQTRTRILLATSTLPLADIAEQLGFSDQSSFGRKCREWFGESPARLRLRFGAPETKFAARRQELA